MYVLICIDWRSIHEGRRPTDDRALPGMRGEELEYSGEERTKGEKKEGQEKTTAGISTY